MKKRMNLLAAIMSLLLLTSCGSSSDTAAAMNGSKGAGFDSFSYTESADSNYEDYSLYDSSEGTYYDEEVADGNPAESDSSDSTLDANAIEKEMLVYTCNMKVDVLDFDNAVSVFKKQLDECGGFVENESYSDGGSTGRWYYENEDKWHTYSATVRVPSSEYESFCNGTAALGDLRSRNASVDNVSTEYNDLSTTLEIYEAKEKRYISLLADITEDEYAVSVERELTELQVDIAKIKSRMNKIKTDVAYSYVNITISEVKEYVEEPVRNDTFIQRLGNTISDTAKGFVNFLEALLLFIISVLPYLVFIGIIVVPIIIFIKKRKRKKAEKKNAPTLEKPIEKEENT